MLDGGADPSSVPGVPGQVKERDALRRKAGAVAMWSRTYGWIRKRWILIRRTPIYGWTKKQSGRFVGATACFLAISVILRRYLLKDNNEAILATTALIILWYTVETWGLRWQMVLQNEIAIRPVVIATIEIRPSPGIHTYADQLVLRNIGRGPALFVQPTEMENAKVDDTRFVARFGRIDCIEAGKDATVEANAYAVWSEGEKHITNFVANLKPGPSKETYDVSITYEDIKGREHFSVVRMGKGGIKLLEHGKKSIS